MHTSSLIVALLSATTTEAISQASIEGADSLARRQVPAPGVGPAAGFGSTLPGAASPSLAPGVGPQFGSSPSTIAPGGVPAPGVGPWSSGLVPAAGPSPAATGADSDGHGGNGGGWGGGNGGGNGGGQGGWPGNGGPSGGNGGNGGCPAVWTEVAKDLMTQFTSGGMCNDLARGAIRAAFHDCGAWKTSLGTSAGCDGSLFLAKEEIGRQENSGLGNIIPQLGQLAQKHKVGMADFFQFAGAVGVKSCPGGPQVQVYVGRKDRSTANPEGLIPNPNSPAADLISNMGDKGINPTELVALLGSHTAAKQFAFDPSKSGAALDNTVGKWDVQFFSAVLKNQAPFVLPSDRVLSQSSTTGGTWRQFAGNQQQWASAFAPAMTKMGMSGVDKNGLIDCTSAIAGGGSNGGGNGGMRKGVNGTDMDPEGAGDPSISGTPAYAAAMSGSSIVMGKGSANSVMSIGAASTPAANSIGNFVAAAVAAGLALAL